MVEVVVGAVLFESPLYIEGRLVAKVRVEFTQELSEEAPSCSEVSAFLRNERRAPVLPAAEGEGWLPPVPVDTGPHATFSPILREDTFGNLWIALLDTTDHDVDIFCSVDKGASWNYLTSLSLSDAWVRQFGFDVDGNSLLFSLLYSPRTWETGYECTEYQYCSYEYGYYRFCVKWMARDYDMLDLRAVRMDVSYDANGEPTGASIAADVPIENNPYRRVWHYYFTDPSGCYGAWYDTIWVPFVYSTDLASEEGYSPNYSYIYIPFSYIVWENVAYYEWYFGYQTYSSVNGYLDTTGVKLSVGSGSSWPDYSSSKDLERTTSGEFFYRARVDARAQPSPGVHVAYLSDAGRAYHQLSTDRGSSWAKTLTLNLGSEARDHSLARVRGAPRALWLVNLGDSVLYNYSSDGGNTWTSYWKSASGTSYGIPSASATRDQFLAVVYKDGNALVGFAPADDADDLGDWGVNPAYDFLAISPGYPIYLSAYELSAKPTLWNGEEVPALAWTHEEASGDHDVYFTRPTRTLFSGTSGPSPRELRLLTTLSRGELLFGGDASGEELLVYSADGRFVLRAPWEPRVRVRLRPGVYFWRVGSKVGKFTLRP